MLVVGTKAVDPSAVGLSSPGKDFSWRQIVEPVEPFLQAVAQRLEEQVEEFEPEITAYARYALTNQGKQLRPALVALSAECLGGLKDDLVMVATIIEMVHLATLVHDDVMDEARIRRRRPTLATQAGNTLSVLVGDCLFAHALKLAASFPTPEVCRAVAEATKTVCSGEILQSQRQRQLTLSRAEYFRVVKMKTAELFALSCDLGARLSGATPAERAALRGYGMALGTAYQVYDDCLDLFGSEIAAGKSLGTDLAGGKFTLPLIAALEKVDLAKRKSLEEMLLDWDSRLLPRLRLTLEQYGILAESQAIIRDFCRSAGQFLEVLPRSEGRRALAGVADFLAQQTEALGVDN